MRLNPVIEDMMSKAEREPNMVQCVACEFGINADRAVYDENLSLWFCDICEDLRYDCPIHGKIGVHEGECPEC